MSRQKQISNLIQTKRANLQTINQQLSAEANRQQILDELLRELSLSSIEQSSETSSVFVHEEEKPQAENKQSPKRLIEKHFEMEDSWTINSEDLSFEIEKIKIFQHHPRPEKIPPKIHQVKEIAFQEIYEKALQNHEKIKPFAKIKEPPKYLPDSNKNKIFSLPQQKKSTFQQESVSQAQKSNQTISKIYNEPKSSPELHFALKQLREEQQKSRASKLQEQKRHVRQQILKQRASSQPQKGLKVSLKEQRPKDHQINLNETTKYSYQNMRNFLESKNDLEDTIQKGNPKTLKYLRYIQKNMGQMNKTQQKIHNLREFILKKR